MGDNDMDIQHYYKKAAIISLNTSIAALLPPFYFIIYGIIAVPDKKLVWLMLPFCIYSLIGFQMYIINKKRYEQSQLAAIEARDGSKDLFSADQMLLTFLPAPSLHLQLFHQDGRMIGELKDLEFKERRWFLPRFADKLFSEKYGLYNENNQCIANIQLKKNHISIEYNNKISVLQQSNRNLEFIDSAGKSYYIENSVLLFDYTFYINASHKAVSLRKGWMPVEWGEQFIDANTPVLTFHKDLSLEEKICMFAIMAKLLRHYEH